MVKADKQRVKKCFTSALHSYTTQATVQKLIQQQLMAYWQDYQLPTQMETIIEIGCGTGGLTQLLRQNISATHWYINDLCDTHMYIQDLFLDQAYTFVCEDAENSLWLKQFSFFDVIVSASVVQWFHDPERFIQYCSHALKQGAYLVLSTFSPRNLQEIYQLTGIGLDYMKIEQWQQCLEKDFDILLLKEEVIPQYFTSPMAILRHLQQTGVHGVMPQQWTKSKLNQFQQDYQAYFMAKEKGYVLTYSPLFIIAKKKG